MNTGAFGEGFPYVNFHELNMDWIIKIAKDFLDQYSHIQEIITDGETALDNKATELENLLQEWYNTHSSDIAEELANAIISLNTALQNDMATFDNHAEDKIEELLDTMPDDYSQMVQEVSILNTLINSADSEAYKYLPCTIEVGTHPNTTIFQWTDRVDRLRMHEYYKIDDIKSLVVSNNGLTGTIRFYTLYFDELGNFVSNPYESITQSNSPVTITLNRDYTWVTFVMANTNYTQYTASDIEKIGIQIEHAFTISKNGLNIDRLKGLDADPAIIVQGTVSGTGTITTWTESRIRTNMLDLDIVKALKVKPEQLYNQFLVASFDADKNWISNSTWHPVTTSPISLVRGNTNVSSEAQYVIVVLRNSEDVTTPLDPSMVDNKTYVIYDTISTHYLYNYINKVEDDLKTTHNIAISPVKGSINQIARIGWLPYTGHTPQQSIPSYTEAYQNGCRIMLCDLRVTSDNKFVLWHDDDVSLYARYDDGTSVQSPYLISTHTLADLKNLDFGLYKGNTYAGTRILTLEEFAKWCGLTNSVIMIETKVQLSVTQVEEVCTILKNNSLSINSIIADSVSYLPTTINAWLDNLPRATYCVRGGTSAPTDAFNYAKMFFDAGCTTMISVTSTNTIDTYGETWKEYGILLEYSEVQTPETLDDFIENDYVPGIQYIASSYFNINEYLSTKYNLY